MTTFMAILLSVLAVCTAVVAFIFLIVPVMKGIAWAITNAFRGVAWAVRHVFVFVFGMLGDTLRALGAVITALVFIPLVLVNILIGRWSASAHFGRGLQDELRTLVACVYRVGIGHPARFFLLSGLVEGIERRVPQAVAEAPGSDKPSRRTGQFEGYTIVGSLQGGGSGGRLYVATPDEKKRAIFARNNHVVDQVVIKSFSLQDGSSLPQIIRESRALEAARKMGLVLDHELSDTRFFYVMPFVPGESLTVVTRRMHAESGADGLRPRELAGAMQYISGLLAELSRYHHGGLWHKDVKPDNIIISDGQAKLVDLGLVTPLRSAMTLTTHGTEYFRDPEMVRMALRGAKVRDVDGVKFDLYGVGAVMYSVIEGSFPAHGGLSQISKKCPEALRWIVRRAMTELNNRYGSADEMLADLRTVVEAKDPWGLKPIDLPSVRGGDAAAAAIAQAEHAARERFVPASFSREDAVTAGGAGAGATPGPDARRSPAPFGAPHGGGAGEPVGRARPRLQVTDWLTGRYVATDRPLVDLAAGGGGARRGAPVPFAPGVRRSAQDQLNSAQARLQRAQSRAASRLRGRRAPKFSAQPNPGVFIAVLALLGALGAIFVLADRFDRKGGMSIGVNNLTDELEIRLGDRVLTVPSVRISGDDDAGPDFDELNRMGERLSADLDKQFSAGFDGAFGHPIPAPAPAPVGAIAPVPASPVLPAAALTQPARGVLMLDTLPKSVDPSDRPAVDELARTLRRSGYGVLGLGAGEQDSDLLAQGRRAIELGCPDDADAIDRLQRWLDGSEGPLDAVLWIGASRSEDKPMLRLVVRGGVEPSRLLGSLQPGSAP